MQRRPGAWEISITVKSGRSAFASAKAVFLFVAWTIIFARTCSPVDDLSVAM